VDVKEYWDRSDDDLYELLGAALLGEGRGLSPEEQDDQRRFGRQWFARQHDELQRRICRDKRVRQLIGTTASDRFIDAVTISEILSSHDDLGLNAALLAVLVARVGLGTFCANTGT
jgi:hypothetical protein